MKKNYRKMFPIMLAVMCCLACISILAGCRNAVRYPKGSFDFQYDSAKYISLGINPYTETLCPTGMQEKLGLDIFYDALEANQFPSMLLILLPYTFFPPMIANWLWMISNMLFSIGIIVLIKKMYFDNMYQLWICDKKMGAVFSEKDDTYVYAFLVCLFFIGLPWRNNIGNGQHTIMAFFFFLLALYLSDRNRVWWVGVALSISFFKYTLTVPLALIFLYKKKYKELVISVSLHIAGTLFSAVWLKASIIDLLILPLKKSTGLAANGAYDIVSIFQLGDCGLVVSSVLMVILFLFVLSRKFVGQEQELLSLLIMISLIVVYHREYDFFVLIIPLIVFGLKGWRSIVGKISMSMLFFDIAYIFVISRILYGTGDNLRIFYVLFALFYYASIIMLIVSLYMEKQCPDIEKRKHQLE